MFLLVIPWSTSHRGGVSVVVEQLHRQWRATKQPSTIVVSDWSAASAVTTDGELRFRFDVFGQVMGRRGALLKSLLLAPVRLLKTLRLLRTNRCSGISFHYPDTNAFGAALLKACRLYRGKLTLSFHGTDIRRYDHWLERLQWRMIFGQADAITTCSASLRARLLATMAPPARKVFVAYNGVDEQLFQPGGERAPGYGPTVLSLGSFIHRKGHDTLLTAFAALLASRPAARLVIAGGRGDELPRLEQMADRAGIAHAVQFEVELAQTEVVKLLQQADLVVQPSRDEPFGLAVIEAAACGVPVLVSAVGGHLEIVEAGSTGWTFAVDDAPGCSAAMNEILNDPQQAATRAQTLRSQVSSRFSWPRLADQISGYLR